MALFQQMMIFFFFMVIGFYLGKKQILDEPTSKHISWIVIHVANPAMILSGVMGGGSRLSGRDLLLTVGIAVGMFSVLIIIGVIVTKILPLEKEDKGIYRMMFVFANIGFMGFPIISAVYGKAALINATIYLLPFNLLIYTYGILCLRSESGFQVKDVMKSVCNIGVIASILAIVLYFSSIAMPSPIVQAVDMLSNLTGPLSMLVIGASFVELSWRDLFSDGKLIVFTLIRLLLIPVIGILIVKAITDNVIINQVFGIMITAPIASMCVMMAKQYTKNDTTASKGVALSTLLAMVSIPLVMNVLM